MDSGVGSEIKEDVKKDIQVKVRLYSAFSSQSLFIKMQKMGKFIKKERKKKKKKKKQCNICDPKAL